VQNLLAMQDVMCTKSKNRQKERKVEMAPQTTKVFYVAILSKPNLLLLYVRSTHRSPYTIIPYSILNHYTFEKKITNRKNIKGCQTAIYLKVSCPGTLSCLQIILPFLEADRDYLVPLKSSV